MFRRPSHQLLQLDKESSLGAGSARFGICLLLLRGKGTHAQCEFRLCIIASSPARCRQGLDLGTGTAEALAPLAQSLLTATCENFFCRM
jgi:hypothetical protein